MTEYKFYMLGEVDEPFWIGGIEDFSRAQLETDSDEVTIYNILTKTLKEWNSRFKAKDILSFTLLPLHTLPIDLVDSGENTYLILPRYGATHYSNIWLRAGGFCNFNVTTVTSIVEWDKSFYEDPRYVRTMMLPVHYVPKEKEQ